MFVAPIRFFCFVLLAAITGQALSSCKKEKENRPAGPVNSLSLNGTALEVSNFATCMQGLAFRINAAIPSANGNGYVVLDIGGNSTPAPGTYTIVPGQPQGLQANLTISTNPATTYQASSGSVTVTLHNNNLRAAFSDISLLQAGTTNTAVASGDIGCNGPVGG